MDYLSPHLKIITYKFTRSCLSFSLGLLLCHNVILSSSSKQALSKGCGGMRPDLSVSRTPCLGILLAAMAICLTAFPVNSHSLTQVWSYSTGWGKPGAAIGVQNGHWTGGLHLRSQEAEGCGQAPGKDVLMDLAFISSSSFVSYFYSTDVLWGHMFQVLCSEIHYRTNSGSYLQITHVCH